ncbi:MAG: DNA mismatch repair protein MutS [Pseudomonadota bacterium]
MQNIFDIYQARADEHATARDRLEGRSRLFSYLRLATFTTALACLFWGLWIIDKPRPGFLAAAGVFLLGFILQVLIHGRIHRRLERHSLLHRIQEEGLARLDHDWDRIPLRDAPQDHATHVADDLDLFGRASLYHLLMPAGTFWGRRALAAWLLNGAQPDVVRARQQAVRELSPLLDLRQELVLGAYQLRSRVDTCEEFLAWASDQPVLLGRRSVTLAARILPALVLVLGVLQGFGVFTSPLWLLPLAVQLGLSFRFGGRIHRVFSRVSAQEGDFRRYADLIRTAAARRYASPQLDALRACLTAQAGIASRQMERLDELTSLADLRLSPMLHLPLQLLTLWDFHVLYALERWQTGPGRHARRWLEALGDLEALAALGGLWHDNPDWAFPELQEEGPRIIMAEGLGHPLIPRKARVLNDVSLGPPGSFLLVTGSNMSGKSTLLRSVGVAVVLAQAGGPVCALRLRLPPLRLATSIHVRDSLEAGVSFFMAELKRLKEVVDLSDAEDPRPLLYLLDEVLRGTNAQEREIAVRRVLVHLRRRGAMGAVTTHDLALARLEGLEDAVRPVHFTETFEHTPQGPRMDFDYRLREGVATTRNALKLVELVGIELDD